MEKATSIYRYGTGMLAAIISLVFLYQGLESFSLFFASFFLLFISITDTFYTKVPNLMNLFLIIIALGFHIFSNGTGGIFAASAGCLAGLVLLFPAYLFRVLGAGDVKALAALGTLTGAPAIFQIFLYTSLIGGGIAVLYYLTNRDILQKLKKGIEALRKFTCTKDFRYLKPAPSNIRFPYAAAIAFGYFAYIQWGSII